MKNLIVITSIIASLAIFSTNSFSEELTGPFVTLGANQFIFDDDRGIDDEADLFLGAGYQFSDHWSLGAEYTELETQFSGIGGSHFNTKFWSVNSVYRYAPRNENSFFWKVGGGKYSETPVTTHKSMARLGLGYDFALSDTFSLTLGTDALVGIQKSRLDWVPYIGLNAFFGSSSKPITPVTPKVIAEQPKDTDLDGVIDSIDQCPTTKPSVKVDARGCELDSDKDGVLDSVDNCPQTPAGAKVDNVGCRIILQQNVSIALNVEFANNSDIVTDAYREEIKKVADFMRQYPDTTVVIEGHTDSRGSAAYNQQLSQKRATAVMNYLVSTFSITQSRVTADGKGEAFPIADNESAQGRQTNRRVQAEIKTSVAKPQ